MVVLVQELPLTEWPINHGNLFLTVLEAESLDYGASMAKFQREPTLFQGCRWLTSQCTLLWWSGRQRGSKFSCDSNSIHKGFILRASSNPNYLLITITLGLPRGHNSKESACQCRRHKRPSISPWVGKSPWRRKWQPIPVFLPEKFRGQRSLVGYGPWSHKSQNTYTHILHTPWSVLPDVWVSEQE